MMGAHRRDIDGLRAVAVIPVVLYHAGVGGLSGGFVGVDVFFVISGFLITSIIRDETNTRSFSLLGFYERRARRILPALFFMMSTCFVAGWMILSPAEFVEFAKSAAATTGFFSNFWFWRAGAGGYFADASEYLPLLHTWSLAVEEQFYVLFPLLLMLLARFARGVPLLIVGGVTLASLALAVIAVERWPSATFYFSPTRAWELGLGALLALGPVPGLRARWVREVVAAGGLVAILFSVFAYGPHTPVPGISALVPCGGAAALIIAGGSGGSHTSAFLSWRPLVFVGLISYSLYLWHWPILAFLRVRLQTIQLPIDLATLAVLAAVVTATISWALVERPFRNRAFLTRKQIFALAGATMALATTGSVVVWVGDGLPNRVPAEALSAINARHDTNPRFECMGMEPSDELCRLGIEGEGPIDFLLWGDSHADAFFPGVDLAAETAGARGLYVGRHSCAPLLSVNISAPQAGAELAREITLCRSWTDRVIAMLQERHDITTVVLASRWASYEVGRLPAGEVGPAAILSEEGHRGDDASNAAVFARGLRRTVDAIVQSGRSVVIIEGSPEFGWNVPGRLYAQSRWGDPLPPLPTAHDVALRNAGVRSVFASLDDDPRVVVVSLTPLLCPSVCRVAFDGRPIFRDDDHVAAFASRELLAPFLAREVFARIARVPAVGDWSPTTTADFDAVTDASGAKPRLPQ